MLSNDLTRMGEMLEARRETDGGLILCTSEADLLIAAVHTAAEDAEGLERSQVGAAARAAVVPFASPWRRDAVKRLLGSAQAAHRAPAAQADTGGDAA